MDNILKSTKISRVSNAAAAGTSDINCTSVDMAGFDTVTFVASFGTLTATQVTLLKLEGSDDNSSFSAISSSSTSAMADGDSNKLLAATINRPANRYVRAVIDRGTANAVVDGVVAFQYNSRDIPTTHASSVSATVTV